MRLAAALALALALAATGGCAGEEDPGLMPGPARIDVDTPDLRAIRQEAGIAECAPGPGRGAVDGGLPALTLPCLGGGPEVDLSSLRGPLVVNLWASWCGPCRREMPLLQRFATAYAGEVGVVGIDYNDPQPMAALELARDSGVTYPLLADPQTDLAGRDPFPNLRGLPYLALVDESGTVVFGAYLEVKSREQLEDLVHEHLGVERIAP